MKIEDAHDFQLELTLLACCIINPDALTEPWANMPAETFYSQKNREVWLEMKKQHRDFGSFDMVTLVSHFRTLGKYDIAQEVLHPAVAEYEGAYHPVSTYAGHYARQLKEIYVRREKVLATKRYENALRHSIVDAEARLELSAVLDALDSSLSPYSGLQDDELVLRLGSSRRFKTGFYDLDRITGGLASPGFNVLAARPSVGKSTVARSIIRQAAKEGYKTFFYSQDQAANQIFELESLRVLQHRKLESLTNEEKVRFIKHVREVVWNNRVTLFDKPLPLAELITAIKTANPDFVVIDYLQILKTGDVESVNRVARASMELKTLAFELQIPVLALAQFNRQYKAGEIPSMSWLKDSGQIEQDADFIMAIERDTNNSSANVPATFYVLKNKVGPTATCDLIWVGKTASYENVTLKGE